MGEKVSEEENPEVKIAACKDASHATDLVTRISVTMITIFVK